MSGLSDTHDISMFRFTWNLARLHFTSSLGSMQDYLRLPAQLLSAQSQSVEVMPVDPETLAPNFACLTCWPQLFGCWVILGCRPRLVARLPRRVDGFDGPRGFFSLVVGVFRPVMRPGGPAGRWSRR
jgi:hypothetical protein